MRSEIRNKLKERREEEVKEQINSLQSSLEKEGYTISFGSIGQRTTYAFLQKGDEEIVGYTYIKDLKYKSDIVGKYKALQQAVTRKSLGAKEEESEENKDV